MNRFRSGSVLVLAAAFVASCGDEPPPLAPVIETEAVLDGQPALAVVPTLTPDGVLLATTDVDDDVDRNGTANAELSLASQIGGGGLDIMTLIDGSGSLGSQGFIGEKAFVADLVGNVLPDPADGRTRMGIIRFARFADLLYRLNFDQTPSVVQALVNSITYPLGVTNTQAALELAIDHFDHESTAGRGKVILLITDGVPFTPSPNPQVVCQNSILRDALMSRGIRVFVVGFGNQFNPQPLACLVDDDTTDIVVAANFDDAVLDLVTTFVNPLVSGVILTATVSPSFEVVTGPTKLETYLIDGTDPSMPSYDSGTRTLTWSLDPVDRQIRNITLNLDPASGNVPVCGVKPALTGLTVNYNDPNGTAVSASLPQVDIEAANAHSFGCLCDY